MSDILLYILVSLPLIFVLLVIASIGSTSDYTPMTYDEEVKWLMEEQGLSREEAEEIANLPWR